MKMHYVTVWDVPLRLFHWLLAAATAFLVASGNIGGLLLPWHARVGLAVLGLLAFRVVWGFVGSTASRFVQFFPTPLRLMRYLKGDWTGVGHTPLGALSVLAMLALVGIQAVSGLFVNDDIAFQGPLVGLVDTATSSALSSYHRVGGEVLLALVLLHVAAIAFYRVVKGRNLVRPMLSGQVEVEHPNALRIAGPRAGALAFAIALAALLVGAVLYYGERTADAAPSSASTPSW